MASITIRQLGDDLKRRLRLRAARNGRSGVQLDTSQVLSRGLSTAPHDRFASVQQFTRALTKALTEGHPSRACPARGALRG